MVMIHPDNHSAKAGISDLHAPMSEAFSKAVDKLGGTPDDVAKVATWLISETAKIIAAAADNGRSADARTFEAMFDVDAVSSHFQSAMEEGIRHATQEIAKDGYTPESARLLAVSRALESVADLL